MMDFREQWCFRIFVATASEISYHLLEIQWTYIFIRSRMNKLFDLNLTIRFSTSETIFVEVSYVAKSNVSSSKTCAWPYRQILDLMLFPEQPICKPTAGLPRLRNDCMYLLSAKRSEYIWGLNRAYNTTTVRLKNNAN